MLPASRVVVLPSSLSRIVLVRQHGRRYASSSAPPSRSPTSRPRRPSRPQERVDEHAEQADAPGTAHQTGPRYVPRLMRSTRYLGSSIFAFVVTFSLSSWLLIHFPLEPRRVTGPSMKPTINPDCDSELDRQYEPTWVLVRKHNLNESRELRRKGQQSKKEALQYLYDRGDLVVYRTPHDPEKVAVKRIVARAGDSVVPLDGYPCGQDPVVVPYNHIWVEGDVNDKKKSMDSNYFGPISTGLVKGKVLAMWAPWWNIFGMRRVNRDRYDWQATKQGRVVENAVEDEAANPQVVEKYRTFEPGRAEKTLHFLRLQSDAIRQRFDTDEQYELQTWMMWQHGMQAAKSHHDPATRERADQIVQELQRVISVEALRAARPGGSKMRRPITGEQFAQLQELPDDVEKQYAGRGRSVEQ